MIFSRLCVLNFWIFCIFANASAQQLTSTLPASNRTCPGTRIIFNCLITGSFSVTNLIIAWSSPKYIGQGTFLQFTTADVVGESVPSMINDDVIAQLLYNGDRSGTPTLESQLQLTMSSDLLSSTVSCHSLISDTSRRVTFYIPSVPGRPHNAKGTEVPGVDGRCVIFVSWDAPLDDDEEDIDHYIVQSPSANIRTEEKSTLISINIPNCIPDIHINVSAVDRCGREGTNAVIVPHLKASKTVNETAPTQQVTTRRENTSGSFETAVIVLGVILGLIIMFVMFVMCICVLYIFFFLKRCRTDFKSSDIRQHTKDQKAVRGREQDGPLAITYPQTIEKSQKLHAIESGPESEPLLKLCSDGCTAEVGVFKSLLELGVGLNILDEDGRHPLWYASRYGKGDLVELFLKYKADINLKTKEGETALHIASFSGDTNVVKLLVGSGAQIDTENKDGWTALHLASKSGHTDVVKLLVDSGALIDNKDKDGQTALHLASYRGHTDVVKLLVKSGAQIDNQDKDGQTALHLASKRGLTDVVKLLVDSGAQIYYKDDDGQTALNIASKGGLTDVVKLLVDSGAQIDNKDKYGQTALHLASKSGHTDVVKLLDVGSGAQIDNIRQSGVSKSGQITDPDRLFDDLSKDIGVKYHDIGYELGLTLKLMENELETGKYEMKPAPTKAMKMLQLWKESVTEEELTYAVLAAALEKKGLKRCAEKYCYTSIATQE